jgi:serine/threonine protein kinase
VLYEMATGRRPFEGNTSAAIFGAILHQPQQPADRLNSLLPADLVRIIERSLEKDRQLRFQTAGGILAELKRLKCDLDTGSKAVAAAGESPKPQEEMDAPGAAPPRAGDEGDTTDALFSGPCRARPQAGLGLFRGLFRTQERKQDHVADGA